MNCVDFEDYWNQRLDSGASLDAELTADSLVHEGRCQDCRRLASGFRRLQGLLPLKLSAELPSADFAERVLNELARSRKPRWTLPSRRLGWSLAVAATLLLTFTTGLLVHINRTAFLENLSTQVPRKAGSQTLTLALAEASKATWAFARDTSAPAARVGSDVLGVSDLNEGATRLSFSMPLDVTVKVDSSSEALRNVGRRVNEGVRPLSGTARAAFGFLLGTSPDIQLKNQRPGSGA